MRSQLFTGRRAALAGVLLLGAALPATAAAPPPLGALTQLSGRAGCFSLNGKSGLGAGTCRVGRGLSQPTTVTVSPDGKYVYETGYSAGKDEGSIAVFRRYPRFSGQLNQLHGPAGCLDADGASRGGPHTCTAVRGLYDSGDGRALAITSDGKWAYLATDGGANTEPYGGAVIAFSRNPSTGVLTQLAGQAGCITTTGNSQAGAGTCRKDTFDLPSSAVFSPDQKFLYVTDLGNHTIRVFSRNPSTGALTDVQCLGQTGGSLPAGCTVARLLGGTQSVLISADGKHAYSGFGADAGISVFDRNTSTGELAQKAGTAGCISNDGKDDTGASTCAVGRALQGSYGIALSPNGQTLYAPAESAHALAVFHVNADGTLAQLAGTKGCISETALDQNGHPCAQGHGIPGPYGAAVSPDGRSLYLANDQGPNNYGSVPVFSLDPTTGQATQLTGKLGCISNDGTDAGIAGGCAVGRAVDQAWSVIVSPDGASVYVAGLGANGIAIFSRRAS